MSKASIYRRISELRSEIRELKSLKNKYEKMINKIDQTIKELKSAGSYADEACLGLEDNYESEEASKKINELMLEKDSISSTRVLAGNMEDEAYSKVTEIKRQIERKERQIDDLYEQSANMED